MQRADLTLQDRLVKELRLRGISSVDAANEYADEFMDDYKRRFATKVLLKRDNDVALISYQPAEMLKAGGVTPALVTFPSRSEEHADQFKKDDQRFQNDDCFVD
ncbi:TPA: hypothetical protein QCH98_003339 [Enterobacter bugandensis]|nr:hypothetical protein [Enterobacter bugandensis]